MLFLCVVGCVRIGEAAPSLAVMLGTERALWITEGTDSNMLEKEERPWLDPHVCADSLDIALL